MDLHASHYKEAVFLTDSFSQHRRS